MEQNRVPTTPVRNFQSTTNTGTWGGVYKTYSYDALNRLTKEYEHDTAQSIYYSYDALGNRVTQKDNRDSLTYTYNELNQLVEKKAYNGLTSYVYDKRGNRIKESSQYTQENRRTYEWDETNRLVRGTRGPDYGLYESTYTYNGLGLRVNSTIMGPDKTKYDRDYVIDYTSPERNDIAEYNVGHTQWNGSKKVHDLNYLYNQDGERLEVNVNRYNSWSSEVVKYSLNIHEDIMGSSVCYTRQDSGYNANKHEYTIWGYNTKAPTYNYDPEYRATEPYYTGHPYDGSLNIYFAENRFYDAETGTWLSKDPARSGMNWYVYCESNPGTYVDPLGLVSTNAFSLQNNSKYFAPMTGSGIKEEYKGIVAVQQLYRYIGKTEEFIDPYEGLNQGTMSFTFGGGGVFLLGAEVNAGISIDFNGNYAIHYSYAMPGVDDTARVGAVSVGYAISGMYTNRHLVEELKGMGESVGGSLGTGISLGLNVIYLDGSQPDGAQVSLGKGVGIDLNIIKSNTKFISEGKTSNILFDIKKTIEKWSEKSK